MSVERLGALVPFKKHLTREDLLIVHFVHEGGTDLGQFSLIKNEEAYEHLQKSLDTDFTITLNKVQEALLVSIPVFQWASVLGEQSVHKDIVLVVRANIQSNSHVSQSLRDLLIGLTFGH